MAKLEALLVAACGAAAASFATSRALAHHSPAAYDMQATRMVEGTVTEYEWGNPHVYLSLRESGSDRVWVVEAFPSTAMKQYGWAANTFAPGDAVIVHVFRRDELRAFDLVLNAPIASECMLEPRAGD